jgi:hypothetical protein
MNSNELSRGLRSFGVRVLTAGLIVCASQSSPVIGRIRAADSPATPANAQQAAWTQGMILAELAWLGNPATFHEHLRAVQVGDCLEIHGAVSNESTRNLAMKLAREASHMTIVDHMQIALAPVAPVPARSLNMVYRDSVQTLYHSCPQLSRSLTVSTQDQGEVLVRGEVATLEDRLAISRALKSVAGCNCVRNQVRARAAGLNAITTVASKAPVQDNSLLVRLGIMQPRMEPVHSAPMIARAEPTREVPGLTASKPQVASLPAPGSSTLKKPATVPPVVTPVSLEQPRVTESPILLTSAPERHDTSKLRSSIASTCGVPETWVKVVAGEGKSLTITLAVADLESGQHLAEKVLALPELVPFGVSLDVTLAK